MKIDSQYKCRQETCFIRVRKTSRAKLKKLSTKTNISIQDLVEKLIVITQDLTKLNKVV